MKDPQGLMDAKTMARFWRAAGTCEHGRSCGGCCWEWHGTIRRGYGYFHMTAHGLKSQWRAHRVAWIYTHGAIPQDLLVLHGCDNKPCVNPQHLHLGTTADNIAEAVSRNRIQTGDCHSSRRRLDARPRGDTHYLRLHPDAAARGEAIGNAKLTDRQVKRLYALKKEGLTQKAIAQALEISQPTVSLVLLGKRWKHVIPD